MSSVRSSSKSASSGVVGVPRLILRGLPERVQQLSRGMIYGVAVDQQSIRLPLWSASLLETLKQGNPAVLLSPAEPPALLRKALLAGVDLAPALKSGQLRLFRHRVDAAKQMFQGGPERLVEELAKYTVGPRSFIVFDQADPFFMLADPKQAMEASTLFAQWAEENDHTLLGMFVPASHAPRDYITLRTLAESFAGFAVVKSGDEASSMEVRHWFGAQGASPRLTMHLDFDEEGCLHARPVGGGAIAAVDAEAEELVGTRQVLDDFGQEARPWKVVDSYLDAIDAARKAKAGTVMLHFSRQQEFRSLCQAVASIRALNRPQLRVVVREAGAHLRLVHVMALLRVGATLTLSRSVSPAQAQATINSLRGTQFARLTSGDVEKVLSDTTAGFSEPVVGFDVFCSSVERALHLAEQVSLPHTMVRLGLQGIGGDRLAGIAARRGARDMLMSVHDDSLWVFLFGCSAADSETVLARLFGRNFERLFLGFSRVEGGPEILRMLSGLGAVTLTADTVPHNVEYLPWVAKA
jgi:cellulose biosynthesis protein BcsE